MKLLWQWFLRRSRGIFERTMKHHLWLGIAIPLLVALVAATHHVMPSARELAAFGLMMFYCFGVSLFARYFVREIDDELTH
jgi:hypothetical protein